MKKLLSILFLSSIFTTSVFSAQPTQYNKLVTGIKADYERDSGNTRKYYYKFSNNVCNSRWIASGDENINTLLRLAYALNIRVDVGINGCSIITTAELKES